MDQSRMYFCVKCDNKVRTLYEWKGIEYCGMCQQENIEKYEAAIIYRLLLMYALTTDYIKKTFGQVFFPHWGIPRRLVRLSVRLIRAIVLELRGSIAYVRAKIRKTKGSV